MALARGSAIGTTQRRQRKNCLMRSAPSGEGLRLLPIRFTPNLATRRALPSHFTLHFTTHIRARRARAFRASRFLHPLGRPPARSALA